MVREEPDWLLRMDLNVGEGGGGRKATLIGLFSLHSLRGGLVEEVVDLLERVLLRGALRLGGRSHRGGGYGGGGRRGLGLDRFLGHGEGGEVVQAITVTCERVKSVGKKLFPVAEFWERR